MLLLRNGKHALMHHQHKFRDLPSEQSTNGGHAFFIHAQFLVHD